MKANRYIGKVTITAMDFAIYDYNYAVGKVFQFIKDYETSEAIWQGSLKVIL